MVAPTELPLTLESLTTSRGNRKTYFCAKENTFAVQSDTDVDVKAFDVRELDQGFILECFNSDPTNGLIFTVYGSADEEATPPDFATKKWFPLPNGSKTVAAEATDAISNTDFWNWILIRVRRQTAALDATANFYIRGK